MESNKIPPHQFQCDLCKGIFDKGWTDEEANAEAIETFGGLHPDDGILCDDCHKEYMKWFENHIIGN